MPTLALLLLSLAAPALSLPGNRVARESEPELGMPEVEGSGEEVVVVEDSEAVEVSDNVVDDETLLNCHKCLKSSFKYRKDLYCSKCVSKGAISADAVASKKVQCKKCRRTAFRAKNIGYCTDICSEGGGGGGGGGHHNCPGRRGCDH